MFKPVAALAVGVIAASVLAGCAASRTEPVTEPVQEPVAEPAMTDEEIAQLAASAMDPLFADPETWEAAKGVARSYCRLAEVSDPYTAMSIMSVQGPEYGVTETQVGIAIGVGIELYCPESAIE